MIKQIVKKALKIGGFQLTRIQNSSVKANAFAIMNGMEGGLNRARRRSTEIQTIIDVGAAQGDWTKMALNYWPQASCILFEPLQEREQVLTAFADSRQHTYIVKAAAGDKAGSVPYFVAEDLDGSGIAENSSVAAKRMIPVTTIDEEIKKHQLKGPYLLKLDTHGYEVPILTGARETLKDTVLVIIECYGFQIAQNSLLFWEMCKLMQEKGFRLIDIVDVMRREKDMAFWQCDAFFIPSHSTIFNSNTYR